MASIRDSVSIIDIYNTYMGTKYSLDFVKRNNIKCPFHDDAKASARIYLDTNTLFCFSCNEHFSPVKFIQMYTKCTSEEAKKIACAIGGIEYKPKAPLSEEEKLFYKVYEYTAGLFHFICTDDYFIKRGFSKDVITKYKLGFCPTVFNVKFSDKPVTLKELLVNQFKDIPVELLDSFQLYDFKGVSRYAERYTFPIFDKYGRVVGFTGRAKGDIEPKYYNTSSKVKYFDKSNLLYNYHVAIESPLVYVVEGTADALSLISSGITNVVAPLGTAFTEEHIKLLAGKQIVLSLDNDKAGLNTMYKLIINNPTIHFSVLLLKGYKDFNEALVAGVNLSDIVKASKVMSAVDFIIYAWKTSYDLRLLANRVALCRKVESFLIKGEYHWLEIDFYNKILRRLFMKEIKEEE